MRRAAKRDLAEPAIVECLTRAGFWVYRLQLPCDLLVGYRRYNDPDGSPMRFALGEVKSGKSMPKANQVVQKEFLALTGTPIWRTPEEALKHMYSLCIP